MSFTADSLRTKYIDFFKSKGHILVPSAPLIPENDPTTLFTGSGMQSMVPYLLGETHPQGKRLVNSQPCFRAEDINQVGDNRHTTFFEMLGNWSLGDYFKTDQLTWFFEFLIHELNLDPARLFVTVYAGDPPNQILRDTESINIWMRLFKSVKLEPKIVEYSTKTTRQEIEKGRIFIYDPAENWWSRAGTPADMPAGEPGGPDSEVFYKFTNLPHDPKYGTNCHPACDCGQYLEIGNNVFMEYLKQNNQTFAKLSQQNVDFGGGLERLLAAVADQPDIFLTDLFKPLIDTITASTGQKYKGQNLVPMRVIADHLRGACFMLAQGIKPANKQQGYILRNLVRRAAAKTRLLTGSSINLQLFDDVVVKVLETYKNNYFSVDFTSTKSKVRHQLKTELERFSQVLDRGLHLIDRTPRGELTTRFAFDLMQTHGFPFELTDELLLQRGIKLDQSEFAQFLKDHQNKSRQAAAGSFKGGLADHSDTTIKYHTATHLLHQALRDILGKHVYQAGSNITSARLRFDFTHSPAMTPAEIIQVEALVNQKITANLPVVSQLVTLKEAKKYGALALFTTKYQQMNKIKLYLIGKYSVEVCGGPHVTSTGQIGHVKIKKEQSCGAGKRRIYLILN